MEGEKDADRLAALDLCANSVSDPNTVELKAFRNRKVFIHEDNDEPGRRKAAKLARALLENGADVRIVRYRDAGAGGDVSDWLDQDDTRGVDELLQRCEESQSFTVSQEGAPNDGGQTTGNSEDRAHFVPTRSL